VCGGVQTLAAALRQVHVSLPAVGKLLGADSAISDMHIMDGNRDQSLAGQVLVASFCCAVDGFGSDGALHVKSQEGPALWGCTDAHRLSVAECISRCRSFPKVCA
jgi:hypothetical protein